MTVKAHYVTRSAQLPIGTLQYSEAGDGPPLILLHGGGPGASGLSNFEHNIRSLARHFRTIVVDQPGYGGSRTLPFEGSFRIAAATAVEQLMDYLRIESAHFLGNSLGGGTTLQLALSSPERAMRLVLMGPGGGSLNILSPSPSEGLRLLNNYYKDEGPTRAKMEAFLRVMVFDQAYVTESLIDERYERSINPEVREGFERTYGSMGGRVGQLWRDLDKVPHRTLLTWGRDDRVLPLDSAFLLLKTMPDARLHVFSRCGHWAQLEQQAEFESLVVSFLYQE